ncbi:Fic family protein [Rubritalea profundi]|uniref:Addiction module protein n=1 Tax=Rubritalea profundi TaxID=1658618 RepID=A0A2S7U3Q5_9BACT|nr:Fic family protein [Rubritalea profundi]PQJ29656.1 addiction module protein [Rubritalea profundi]
MSTLSPLPLPPDSGLETREVWRALNMAHRYLAELKGVCLSLPNPSLLTQTLSLQEAKDSSEIENIITTHDDLYATQGSDVEGLNLAAKEVQHYVQALQHGFKEVRDTGLIRLDTILAIQAEIEQNEAGLRALPGTMLKNDRTGETIYQPPQSKLEVEQLMTNLVDYIHDEQDELDPLLRMAIIHHQFESIHPFYDGNGRTGRILNILVLVREGLLDLPILYLSRYINHSKASYYELLQKARDENRWDEWCVYILKGITETAKHEIQLIGQLTALMRDYKHRIRKNYKFYSQDLLNNLFRYPYTKIEFIVDELGVSRPTATKYLDRLAKDGFLDKKKMGRSNFYVNTPLFTLLTSLSTPT